MQIRVQLQNFRIYFKLRPIVYGFQNKTSKWINNVKPLAGQLIYMNQPRFNSGVEFPTHNDVLKYSTYFNAEREFPLYYIQLFNCLSVPADKIWPKCLFFAAGFLSQEKKLNLLCYDRNKYRVLSWFKI